MKPMRRNSRYFAAGGALLTVTLLGCGQHDDQVDEAPVERASVPESPFRPAALEDTLDLLAGELGEEHAAALKLDVVLGGEGERWAEVSHGAARALEELGSAGDVVAPMGDEAAEQLELLKREREATSDGLGLAPINDDLQAEMDRAAAEVPVITIDSDLPASKRDLFAGFGQYEMGQRLGDAVLQLMPLREGTVVILGTDDEQQSPDGFERSLGARDVMVEVGLDVVIRNGSTAEDGEAADIETVKSDLLDSELAPLAVLGVLPTAYRIAAAAELADQALAAEAQTPEPSDEEPTPGLMFLDRVVLVAYGLEPRTVEYLQRGLLAGTLVERRYYMGYFVPYVLAAFNLLGAERTRYLLTPHLLDSGTLDVGADLVVGDELDAYLEFQRRLAR